MRWNVGDFWNDKWIPNLRNFNLESSLSQDCPLKKVCDFIDPSTECWKSDSIALMVSDEEAKAITSIPLSLDRGSDKLIWHYASSGEYSVKSGYKVSMDMAEAINIQAPGPSEAIPQLLWKHLWKIQSSPSVKHFI
ncbi:hypothetical protein Acr_26g0008480 [Actinidia rufa]|uniref:Uncharacterized protein n=1 Tax=Actinidia rufa TaxID=165716 RepID=A0A7J0H3J4_9ERIC|nr:hypothetical protein Acr_26g0008480 [Actinidia rufa]